MRTGPSSSGVMSRVMWCSPSTPRRCTAKTAGTSWAAVAGGAGATTGATAGAAAVETGAAAPSPVIAAGSVVGVVAAASVIFATAAPSEPSARVAADASAPADDDGTGGGARQLCGWCAAVGRPVALATRASAGEP